MEIQLQPEIEKAIRDIGFKDWTDIQIKSIPLIQQGRDVIGQSLTGSGKTAAFGLPLLEKVVHGAGLQALILAPTRELAEQVSKAMRSFSKYKRMNILPVYGGVAINPQIDLIPRADIIIGTPGRLLDHLERRTLNLSGIKMLVLDEADKMFEMGFVDDVRKIMSMTSRDRQTMLFSATFSRQIEELIHKFMNNPATIKVQAYIGVERIGQYYYNIRQSDKFSLLVHLLQVEEPGLTMIFCGTRRMVEILARNLKAQGINAQPLHGGMSQNKRQRSIDMFHDNKTDILIASDVAARGLDIKNVSYVVNYDIPKTSKEYIHRIGRTARAGTKGKVISLLSEYDHDNFRSVKSDSSIVIEKMDIPEFKRIGFSTQSNRSRRGPDTHSGNRHTKRPNSFRRNFNRRR